MDVSRVPSSLPDPRQAISRKSRSDLQAVTHNPLNAHSSNFSKQESYQHAYEQFQPIQQTDLSIYQEVEQYLTKSELQKLLAFSFYV